MKQDIKKILREGINKNKLNVLITKPTQEVIIMRGIPGAGKSFKAKTLLKEGRIHSTDDLIEAAGNYNDFFANMVESKDFKPLSRMHSQNLKNFTQSINEGISPVIVDNTNIKKTDAKAYIKKALELGISENNIKIVDIGTGGLDAKILSERNTHGVPFDKIEKMIASHKGQGEFTIENVLKAKDAYKESDVLYSCVLLEKASQNVLFHNLEKMIPEGWIRYGHHMTINLGPLKDKSELGESVMLRVLKVGISDMAIAVMVDGFHTSNAIPHVTVAINPDGAKPVMSNQITKWQDVRMFLLMGDVTEIKKRAI